MSHYLEVLQYSNFLLVGIRWTITISLIGIFGGSIVGFIAALAKLSSVKILNKISSLYIDFFRTTPLLVQLVWIYYALPLLIGYSFDGITAGAIGMSLYAGSFIAEIIRAGILSISKSQTEAALALGMTNKQAMVRIVLPQAIVRMLPPLGSTYLTMVKDSSMASVIGVPELVRQANALGSFTLRRMEVLTVAALIYFIIVYPLSLVVNQLYKKFAID